MYRIRKSIDVDFSHHVRGHSGACINIHGHTWKFEVGLEADVLDKEGFVVDFKALKKRVLAPVHALLDHGLAVGEDTYAEIEEDLAAVGRQLVASRVVVHGPQEAPTHRVVALGGAENRYPGGIKLAVFPFDLTSERLARWLWTVADEALADDRVRVSYGRVYETLHPVEAVAEYAP